MMKKVINTLLLSSVMVFGLGVGLAHAAEGTSIDAVKELQEGSKSIENVAIGDTIDKVEQQYGEGIRTESASSDEQYYEYHLPQGLLIITTNHNGETPKVSHITMSYNDIDGASYDQVKNVVDKDAITRAHFNDVTGNQGYIQDDQVSYQFTTDTPKDKTLKLYRIDLGA
ncbi:SA0570 family protein [Staphylococcus sp. 11261D007BR]